ncbi:D-inositol 3-phosphate glycosyltransferase-like [Montipora foliosa]|uniref:D-inositol 3-phosphate glycosyltransferase-like n=1 Tax=Montipora foliosa TaxID=591990 RepID=UPI0035F18CC5
MATTSSQCSQEHCQAFGKDKPVQVTILASEWRSTKGGLSTINRELAIQLAKFADVKITFFLPKCSNEDKEVALSHDITIREATPLPGYEELEWLSFPPEDLRMDVIVGHGVKLGHQAQAIRRSHKCQWVQVVHTDPEELGMFKGYENPISKGEEKHNTEVKLCEMADFVVAVGPKLADAFRKYLRSCQKDQGVFDFTPGIFDEFVNVQQVPEDGKHCGVLVFGRGDSEDFKLKGFDIAATSVAALPDTCLIFVGAPDGKRVEIAKRLLEFGIPENRLRVRGYAESRDVLRRLFCEVDVAIMPSRTEGFGLTGLEALSAGLPVIVSKNSGFGEALCNVPFGSSFVIDSEDPNAWTAAIKNIWNKNRQTRLDEAKALRDSYGKKYSWSEQCKDLVKKMMYLVQGSYHEAHNSSRAEDMRQTGEHTETKVVYDNQSGVFQNTISSMRGSILTLRNKGETVTIQWKQQSFIGFGGDRSQSYVLCHYITERGRSVPVFIQKGYSISQSLKIDSKLQYGTQGDVIFLVYHDKSQTPYQERFRCNGLQTFYAAGINISWIFGHYLVDV